MVPLTRDSQQQKPPTSANLKGFPTRNVSGPLWRAAQRSPWWYCSNGDCRFDLQDPYGTCYLGTDELVGILESIGAEISNGLISSVYLDTRKLYKWEPEEPLRLADLVSRGVAGRNVTNELSTMTPYDIPQQWAEGLAKNTEGILYRSRFDPGEIARAIAHFGKSGLSSRAIGKGRSIGVGLRRRLESECQIKVAIPPQLSQLTIADDPV
ncbi:MAG: RES family NAD+ phosphorylase [Acidimicrobiales bacterium]